MSIKDNKEELIKAISRAERCKSFSNTPEIWEKHIIQYKEWLENLG